MYNLVTYCARCLADGQSAAFIINSLNREERRLKEEEEKPKEPNEDKNKTDKAKVLGQVKENLSLTLKHTACSSQVLSSSCFW